MQNAKKIHMRQAGFSLVELMVGLAIGLLASLVIMQVFSVFEGQKRSTSSSADAQTNGTLALMHIQSHLQTAGYGMPMPNADPDINILNCGDVAGETIFPVQITNGAANSSDSITVRYSGAGAGAAPIAINNHDNSLPDGMYVANNMGCKNDREMSSAAYKDKYRDSSDPNNPAKIKNMVMVMGVNECTYAEIAEQPVNNAVAGGLGQSYIKLKENGGPVQIGGVDINKDFHKLACMGGYVDHVMDVQNEDLMADNQALVSGVVRLHAQYGVVDDQTQNTVTSWVDADGIWATPSRANRNRIRAVRVALVLRNGERQRERVTMTPPTAWTDSGTTQIALDVSDGNGGTEWQFYRYRVFSTTVPVRNMLWSRQSM